MTAHRRGQPVGGAQDRDGSVGVRTQHPDALSPQGREGAAGRMAVQVAGTAGDQRQPGRQPVYQRRVLVGGAVVRHLQHIDRAQLRMSRQQRPLCGWFEVAEQQDGEPVRTDEQGDAGVVRAVEGFGTVAAIGAGRLPAGDTGATGDARAVGAGKVRAAGAGEVRGSGWPQDLPGERPQVAALARCGTDERDPCRGSRGAHELRLPRRIFQGRGLDRPDRAAAERPGKPVHMVGVMVFFALSVSHETSGLAFNAGNGAVASGQGCGWVETAWSTVPAPSGEASLLDGADPGLPRIGTAVPHY